jgi:competence protein ComEC
MRDKLSGCFFHFLGKNPAFVYGLFFLSGLSLSHGSLSFLTAPLFLCSLFFFSSSSVAYGMKRLLPFLAVLILAAGYGYWTRPIFPASTDSLHGTGYFSPTEIKSYRSPFHRSYMVKGSLLYFKSEDGIACRIPCLIYLPSSIKRPPLSCDFIIHGELFKKDDTFVLKPDRSKDWETVPGTFCLAEWRFQCKQLVSSFLKKRFSDTKVSDFLIALSLGELDDRMLRFEFNRLGMQHILAISGFHFGLLAAFFGFFLHKLLPRKLALTTLLCLLTSYFFLLGASPSILRAWVAIGLYIAGCLMTLIPSGINVLGVGLLVELLLDPQVIHHLGFQLSFLSTAAILILLPACMRWMHRLFPKRPLAVVCSFSPFHKIIYLFCCFLRMNFALNLAVHLAMLPVCLFYFHKFPLMSFIYNQFFPLGVSLSMFFLIASFLFFWTIPPVAQLLCEINESITSFLLTLSSYPPSYLDRWLYFSDLPMFALVLFEIFLFSYAILSYHLQKQKLPSDSQWIF